MKASTAINSCWLDAVLDRLSAEGLDTSALLAGLDSLKTVRSVPNRQLEVAAVRQLWHRVAAASGDPLIGVKTGFSLPLQATHIVSLIALHSRNVREAMQNTGRYQSLISNSGFFTLQRARDRLTQVYEPASSPVPIHPLQIDSVLAGSVGLMRKCGLTGFAPEKAVLTNEAKGLEAAFEAHFLCPVELGAPKAMLVYGEDQLGTRLPQTDPGLLELLTSQAETLLQNQKRLDALALSVRSAVLAHGFRETHFHKIAADLGMSPRTLQRRLQSAGTTFRHLLEDARMDGALSLLRNSNRPIPVIADMLGYSEASSFSRAVYKRWGKRPPDLRRMEEQPR